MRRIALPLLLLVALGCGSKPTMVGTWTIPVDKVPDLVANLSSDKKVLLTGTYQTIKLTATGTWELNEDTLTVKPNKIDVPEEIRALLGPMIAKEEKKFLVPVSMTVEWVNDDEIRVTPPSGVSEIFNKPFIMRRQVASQ